MLKIIKTILLFILSIIGISIALYFYVYKGFIGVYEDNQDQIQYKEIIQQIYKKEETIEFQQLFFEQLKNNKHEISKLITQFLDNKNLLDIIIKLQLKKEGIVQVNQLLNTAKLQENSLNSINIQILSKNLEEKYILIDGKINNLVITFKGLYNNKNNTILIIDIDMDALLTLLNYHGYVSYFNDGFTSNYTHIIGKKIKIDKNLLNILDFNIPESKIKDLKLIINNIEKYINFNEGGKQKTFSYIIDNKKNHIKKDVRNYIINHKLDLGQKQNLMIDVLDILDKLDKTGIDINNNEINIYNNGKFFFDFNITLSKKTNGHNLELLKKVKIDDDFTYTINELYKIFLIKNKLLVKYVNGEDLLFLIQ